VEQASLCVGGEQYRVIRSCDIDANVK